MTEYQGAAIPVPARGRRRRAGILLVAALALLAGGAGGVRALVARPSRPSVLLVSIDTLRSDFAGSRHGTPAIARFLAEATRFEGARTTVPLTLPAHASLFTGLSPRSHGVRDNVGAAFPRRRKFTTLAEEFTAAGYATAGFAAAPVLDPRTGVGAGFERYECPPPPPELALPGDYGDLPAEKSVARALEWLAGRRAETPFFLWLHFYDPHDPYLPFPGDAERPGTRPSDPDALRYAGEVRRVDAALDRLLRVVPAGTIVVLVSDHGEALGEHGERTHGALCFSATSDIFLAVRAPGLAPGATDRQPRSICDIAPSLRSWCDLAPVPSDGAPLFEETRRPVVTESFYYWRLHGWGQCFSVSNGRRSLVESGSAMELYDLDRDPAEVSPKEPRGALDYETLDRVLEEYRAEPAVEAAAVLAAASPYGSLRRAGAGGGLPRGENQRLVDPRTRFALVERIEEIRGFSLRAMRERSVPGLRMAAEAMARLAREDPLTAVPFLDLFYIHAAIGEFAGDASAHRAAAAAAQEIVRRGCASPDLLRHLCRESLAAGELSDLHDCLQTVSANPASIDGRVAGEIGRIIAALEARGAPETAERGRELLRAAAR